MPPVDAGTLAKLQQGERSNYLGLDSSGNSDGDAFRGIDALHRYYDAHKSELIAQWQQLEAERIAREQFEKENPPRPKDTVIQFWPKKNSRYLNAVAGSADTSGATGTVSGKEAK